MATMDKARPKAFGRVREAAAQIAGLMARLDPVMTAMCHVTCPDCTDNCCARATIWYDFRDLLFLYFNAVSLPDRQIGRRIFKGRLACSHLTASGCALQRHQRPFVCTWYLCNDQKRIPGGQSAQVAILKIQALRRDMEDFFCGNCL